MLVLVILLTGLTAAIDTAAWAFGGPQTPSTIEPKLEPEPERSPAVVLRRRGRPGLAAVVLRHAGVVPARGGLLAPAARPPGRSCWPDGRRRSWCRWPSP